MSSSNEINDNNNARGDASPRVVTFNVGGTIYQVSRSLLASFPDTMLARIASETWQSAYQEEEEEMPIFIDRDGHRFRFCLDYMRDGQMFLPMTVRKEAVIQDLEYYGIEYDRVSGGGIHAVGSLALVAIQAFEEEKTKKHDWMICSLANEIVTNFLEGGASASKTVTIKSSEKRFRGQFCDTNIERLNQYLQKFGLKCIEKPTCYRTDTFERGWHFNVKVL